VVRRATAWQLWQQPAMALVCIIAVDLAALSVPAFFRSDVTAADFQLAALLTTLSIAYSAVTCRAERARRAILVGTEPARYQNLLGVWGLASAVLLPMQLAWAVAVVAAISEWPSRNVNSRARPYRYIYSSAGAILAGVAAHLVARPLPVPLAGIASAPVYMVTGIASVVLVQLAARQRAGLASLLRPATHRVEATTLLIAIAETQLAAVHFGMLIWLSLPAAIGLQQLIIRNTLRRVAKQARIEPMSEEAWSIAATEIVSALPAVSIMRIGSAEPAVVAAVTQLQAECDALGLIASDELAVLLLDCPDMHADALAARLRTVLADRQLPTSVAVAAKPRDGHTANDLLAVCEAELIVRNAARSATNPLHPET
jgi:hypothetical protein